MHCRTAYVVAGLCLAFASTASAQASGTVNLMCTFFDPFAHPDISPRDRPRQTGPSFAVTIDLKSQLAKGWAIAYTGQVPFSRAQITSDNVTWSADENTHYSLSRSNGVLTQTQGSHTSIYNCTPATRVF
jgi:hypothetical protein